ncbi:MAG: sugar-binding protein [Thermomicrobiales bacterium]
MPSHRQHRYLSIIVVLAMLFSVALSQGVAAQGDATPSASPIASASPLASPSASPVANETMPGSVNLDVLFIGAHPDDEAGGLSTYGQWNEFDNVKTGVITVTRGEGGGNAVGTEEGPALGLLRENEERNAVGKAGIDHIYNLDKVDFYYTVSAPLTEETWGYDDTLARVVRVIRETQPKVIITMNPAPTPGNHGHHQLAARLAVAGYYAAADPSMFPEQITNEGLQPWTVSKIFRSGAAGEGEMGETCASTYKPAEPTDVVYGVWGGRVSDRNGGLMWSQVERSAQQMYASQGWAAFPDASTDPNETGCDFFTLIDSRVPYTIGNSDPTAMLEGAVVPTADGLPLGAQFSLTTSAFNVTAGSTFDVTAHFANLPAQEHIPGIELQLPDGWTLVPTDMVLESDGAGGSKTTMSVKVADDAAANTRYRIGGTISADNGDGSTVEVVQVVPNVRGVLAPLPQVEQFKQWAISVGAPQLDNLIKPVATLGSGESREITIDLSNSSGEPQSGTVSLDLPEGFAADTPSKSYADIAAGGSGSVTFTVKNTDASLPTSNEGGVNGDYDFTITTEAGGDSSTQTAALEIVPVTTVGEVTTQPKLDGVISDGEYPGEAIDLSRIWEGDPLDSPEDAGGSAHIAWGTDGIYVAVAVQDDTLGKVLPQADAKRHWRTDSVEIAIDPLGTAENTSAAFKVGVFPTTTEGGPAAYRDADAFQGPVSETAPGFEVASTVSEPYTGYVIETFIPFSDLPADINPENATMNVFIYDSDTQDLTGQTRLGWSTWNGVQGDPYRWGKTHFEGYTPPADARTTPDAPKMPLEAAHSVDSPLSIRQSAMDGVGLAGMPRVPKGEGLVIKGEPVIDGTNMKVTMTSVTAGTVTLFDASGGVFDATKGKVIEVIADGEVTVLVPRTGDASNGMVLISFQNEAGDVQALGLPYDDN